MELATDMTSEYHRSHKKQSQWKFRCDLERLHSPTGWWRCAAVLCIYMHGCFILFLLYNLFTLYFLLICYSVKAAEQQILGGHDLYIRSPSVGFIMKFPALVSVACTEVCLKLDLMRCKTANGTENDCISWCGCLE